MIVTDIRIPPQLQKVGYKFILLKAKDKTPLEKWQDKNYTYDDPILLQHIKDGRNYGYICNNPIVVDSDSEEVTDIAELILKETFTIKTGSPEEYKKHFIFELDNPIKPIRLSKATVGDLGDIRSFGQYVVGPTCIHPSGNKYIITKDIPITKITQKELLDAFKGLIEKTPSEFKEFPIDTTKRTDDYIQNCKIPDYLVNNKIRGDTSKNWTLFRYISDIAYNRGLSKEYLLQLCNKQGHQPGAIIGWIEKARQGKLEKSSCLKVKEYLNRFHPDLIENVCGSCKCYTDIPPIIQGKIDNIKSLGQLIEEGTPEIEWLVEGLVPKQGICIFGGTAGSYKTFLAQSLTLSCATGTNFLGKFITKKCNVLYIDEENGRVTMMSRYNKLIKGMKITDKINNLFLCFFNGVYIDAPDTEATLTEFIKKFDINLVIVDSMVRAMIGDENQATDVRKIFDNFKKISMNFEDKPLSLVLIHHTTKLNQNRILGLRGSGDFAAFADVVVMFSAKLLREKPTCEMRTEKNRLTAREEWPELDIEINIDENEGITFRASEKLEIDKVTSCAECVWEWIKYNLLINFHTNQMFKAAEEDGFNKSTYYRALDLLTEQGKIKRLKAKGMYQRVNGTVEEEIID